MRSAGVVVDVDVQVEVEARGNVVRVSVVELGKLGLLQVGVLGSLFAS